MAATALPPFDPERLARFLAEASGARHVEITGPELLAGGAIQENWGFDAEFAGGTFAGRQRLVLRTDAPTGVAVQPRPDRGIRGAKAAHSPPASRCRSRYGPAPIPR